MSSNIFTNRCEITQEAISKKKKNTSLVLLKESLLGTTYGGKHSTKVLPKEIKRARKNGKPKQNEREMDSETLFL